MNKDLRAVAILGIMVLAATMISTVVVLAQETPPPTLVSIPGGLIPYSGTFEATITADTLPAGLTGYSMRVTTGDSDIATPIAFTSPDFGLTDLDATSTAGSLRLAVVDLNHLIEVGATEAVLGTVTFYGWTQGTTTIQVDIERLDDEGGFPILASVTAGLLTVAHSRDLDGDGLTEDFNGNGLFDFGDVEAMFRQLLAGP